MVLDLQVCVWEQVQVDIYIGRLRLFKKEDKEKPDFDDLSNLEVPLHQQSKKNSNKIFSCFGTLGSVGSVGSISGTFGTAGTAGTFGCAGSATKKV